MNRKWLVAIVIVTALSLVVAGGCASVMPAENSVSIRGLQFNPGDVVVTQGSTVTWTNNDETAHTITSIYGDFHSKALNPGESFSFTFKQKGKFRYQCHVHPYMHGSVTVK